MARSKASSKKTSSKKEEKEKKETPIRKYAGAQSGQRLTEWFTHTFESNYEDCFSDDKLAEMTRDEFPMGKDYQAGDIKTARGRFNKGVLLKNQSEIFVPDGPDDYLPEFDDEGEAKPIRGRGKKEDDEEEKEEKTSKKKASKGRRSKKS